MKESGKRVFPDKKWKEGLARYKYVLLVLAAGIVLLLLPTSVQNVPERSENPPSEEEDYSVDALEEKLEEILSEMEGAGRVKVMLTVKSGMKRVFAQDGIAEQEEGTARQEIETVVISSGSGVQETVLVQQIYPQFQGALVVAEGGGDPSVQLKLTNAVAALTGLGADKISICKGK